MSFRTQSLILLTTLLGFISGSVNIPHLGFSDTDGAFYTEDAVILNAPVGRTKRDLSNGTRDGKQIFFIHPRQQVEEAFGTDCLTMLGKQGTCKSFKECYPYIKVSDFHDAWIMGQYDTCSYISGDNMEVFGVCCTEPVSTPPQDQQDVQRVSHIAPAAPVPIPPMQLTSFQSLFPSFSGQWPFPRYGQGQGVDFRQIPAVWPPPIPTHPPDHAAPTHPPSLIAGVGGMVTSPKPPPAGLPTKPTTTWPTKAPGIHTTQPWWQTTQLGTKPPTAPTLPTNPPAVASGSCGAKNGIQRYESTFQDEERIVGGHNADLNEWPWIAALFNGGRQFCGGSLIDDRHVLSAAHCVAHMTSWDVARLTARLGDHNIRTDSETRHEERKIKRVVRHRGFDMRTLYNDISILTLDRPVTFSSTIRPICLPSGGSRSYTGQIATVIGWGSLRESGPQPSVLQEVSIPVWTNQECRLKYGAAAPGGIVEHMLCAGKASMDSCSGDSGGPLMVNEGGRWTQVGIVSWGIGCGKGQYPGVYTRVTYFMPWIQKNSQ